MEILVVERKIVELSKKKKKNKNENKLFTFIWLVLGNEI